jgi:uncharacterized membrane protein
MLRPFLRTTAFRREWPGLALVALATAFTAWFAAPELRIERVPINDVVYHLAASERLATAFERGEPFLDPWVSEWALGYPVWRTYQPLGHIVAAAALKVLSGVGEPASIFAALLYALLVLFPGSVYVGARLLGLSPPAAGLSALLVLGTSAQTGDLERFGIGYGSSVWRGAGLYTQLVGLHVLVLAVGAARKALDVGDRTSRVASAVLLALTTVSHIVLGYAAFVSLAILAVVGPRQQRATRLVRMVTIAAPALLMLAWFVVPYVLGGAIANHSRWEPVNKWDSYGAPMILQTLISGAFFDANRLPALTLLIAAGAATAAALRADATLRRLLALAGFWLVLFFGRATWGHLVTLAGVPADLPMHRFQAVFELFAILLGSAGVAALTAWLWPRDRWLALLSIGLIAAAVGLAGRERATYLDVNGAWGELTLAEYATVRADLDAALADARSLLDARPGRVSAGLASSWGGTFKVGSASVFAFLSLEHFDQASFLYHAMSKTSDVMIARAEDDPEDDRIFGVRVVVAPAGRLMPPHLRLRSTHGRFAVYESSAEGYFSTVDVVGHYAGDASTTYDASATWLRSPLPAEHRVISFDPRLAQGPAVAHREPMPASAGPATPPGTVLAETKQDERYEASLAMDRPGFASLKITWNPDLHATVDGRPAPVYQVSPGLCAIPMDAGQHAVRVEYAPGPLRAILFVAALGVPLLAWLVFGGGGMRRIEAQCVERLARVGERLWHPALPSALAVVFLGIVATHPLFRGQLAAGHDSLGYPPRVTEMARALSDWHIPTIWAPDLSAGHGQPLFEFAPPLVYWMAMPFHAAGFGISNALQFGLALLCFAGAFGVYRIGRLLGAPRYAAACGAVAWLFAPYFSLDLFVRSAYAEAAAAAVAPLALWMMLRAARQPTVRHTAEAAVAAVLIQLGHNAAALLLLPACAATAFAYAWAITCDTRTWRPTRIAPLIAPVAAMAGALGLGAWYWMPAMLDTRNLHAERFLAGGFNLFDHFLAPWQLLWGRWQYGTSVAGTNDGMSFDLGPVHLALAIGGLVMALRSTHMGRQLLAVMCALIALVGALLPTTPMMWIWSHVTTLQFFVYPWRALIVPMLFMPVLAIFAFERLGPRWSAVATALLVAISLPHTEPRGYLTFDEDYYAPRFIAANGLHTSTQEEYEPRWTSERPPYSAVGLTTAGAGQLSLLQSTQATARQEYVVRASAPLRVETNTYFYPGWTAIVDGRETAVTPVPVRGTMAFDLAEGEHTVVLELRRTPVINAALLVSAITALLFGLALSEEARQQRRIPRTSLPA